MYWDVKLLNQCPTIVSTFKLKMAAKVYLISNHILIETFFAN